ASEGIEDEDGWYDITDELNFQYGDIEASGNNLVQIDRIQGSSDDNDRMVPRVEAVNSLKLAIYGTADKIRKTKQALDEFCRERCPEITIHDTELNTLTSSQVCFHVLKDIV